MNEFVALTMELKEKVKYFIQRLMSWLIDLRMEHYLWMNCREKSL